MSSVLLMAKAVSGVALVGSVGAVAAFAINSSLHPNPKPTSVKAVIVKASSGSASTPSTPNLTVGGQETNYKCRLTTITFGTGSACQLVKLDTAAKWIDITKINSASSSEAIAPADLITTGNYFKLIVESALFAAVSFTSTVPTIDIVSVADTPTSYATLTPLFKVDGTTPDFTHATHLIGKSPAAKTEVKKSDSGSKSMCSLLNTSAAADGKECEVLSFGSTALNPSDNPQKYSTQTSINFTTSSTSLTTNNYYLLKYATPTTDLIKTLVDAKTTAYVTDSTNTTWASKGSLTDVAPVIIDGTSTAAVAFILSTHTPGTSD